MGVGDLTKTPENSPFWLVCPQATHFIHSFGVVIHRLG